MANRKPNISFPKILEVPKGRPEEGAKKDVTFVPLVNALTCPKEDVRHQTVNVRAALGIYATEVIEKTIATEELLRGPHLLPTEVIGTLGQECQIYSQQGGTLIHTVVPQAGFRYLQVENGEEFLFLEKRQTQKMVKELKTHNNLTWPLWLVFATSKDDLPGDLSEFEKPEPVVLPEEVPQGLLKFSNPDKSNPQEFDRCCLAWVKLFKKGLLDDVRLQEDYSLLSRVRETWESKRNHARGKMESVIDDTAYEIWKDRFYEAKFFLKRIGPILELADAEIGPVLEHSKQSGGSTQFPSSRGLDEPPFRDENISAPVATNGNEELEREKTAKTETKEFDPRDLGKGERGKLIAIAVSGKRSGFTLPQIASAMQKTDVVCPSKKGYTMFKEWYKKDSKNFYGFLYRLRIEGEEWEEATGQRIPDKYCKKYQ